MPADVRHIADTFKPAELLDVVSTLIKSRVKLA
jgi:hypothetical protein